MNKRKRAMMLGLLGGSRENVIDVICPAITPITGDELSQDPGLELWSSDTDLTKYTEFLGSGGSINKESTIIRNGSFSVKITNVSGLPYVRESQSLLANVFIQFTGYCRGATGSESIKCEYQEGALLSGIGYTIQNIGTEWRQYLSTMISSDTTCHIRSSNSTANSVVYFDDLSKKYLTFSSLISFIGTREKKGGSYFCYPTIETGTQAGLIINYADENNFILGIIHRNSPTQTYCYLLKKVAGVFSIVTSGTVTYGASKQLKILVDGTSYSIYYDGTQEGTTSTIDNSIMGFDVYGISTCATNVVGRVITSPNINFIPVP